MGTLERKVKPSQKLLIILILSILSSLFFTILFSLILHWGKDLSDHKAALWSIGFLAIWMQVSLITISIMYYFNTKEESKELDERAKFTYLWAIFSGYLLFIPILIFRSYYLSGGKLTTIVRAKREYEENIIDILFAKAIKDKDIVFEKKTLKKINNVQELYKNEFITSEEKDFYLWEILNKKEGFIKKSIDYESPEVIHEVSEIVETY